MGKVLRDGLTMNRHGASDIGLWTRLKRFHQRLNGSTVEYNLAFYRNIVNDIDRYRSDFELESDDQLKKLSQKLQVRARKGNCLDDICLEAFALVREAVWRVLRQHPFDVQLIGALVMYHGKLAEMQTGEGKTLTAVFPAYVNALTGKGVHVLTFNDYLARRDARWMGPVYNFLGLSVGFVQEGMSTEERQRAYRSDITYLTAKEAGFDFLRDTLCYNEADIVHREFNFAIVDEADSILIDEARIPLIIAGSTEDYVADTYYMAQIARQLEERSDFEFDEYARNFHLTERGLRRVEKLLKCGNLYDERNLELLTRLNCAIHAEYLLSRDVDYIVRNEKVELVDEFTGRVADKRRWPDGLQAAIEAKENIAIQSRGNILNSITLQHFLQLYPKIAGMTATAHVADEEFREFYNLHIAIIPPNKPCVRIDHGDEVYRTKKAKQKALINEIIGVHKTKRPILVGTRSVEESALLAEALSKKNVSCSVLNAKNDEFEAEIVAKAGKLGAITISTNMAGRGTDIRLGASDDREHEEVKALGGLYVIGTNKHESARIDNQLRGRAGRQGDPGSSRFFISLEDDLFVRYRLKELIPSFSGVDGKDGRIESIVVRREIDRIQRIVEGQNLEIKKTVYKYSSLLEKQRTVISQTRRDILFNVSIPKIYRSRSKKRFDRLTTEIGRQQVLAVCRQISLFYLDRTWSRYLAEIADIREGIHLTRLGGQIPVFEFNKQAVAIFDELMKSVDDDMIEAFNRIKISGTHIDFEGAGLKTPASTWTYLINDDPFENMLGIQLIGNMGLSVGAGLYGVLVAFYPLLKKIGDRMRQRHSDR
jgi:preprotein translocase subunit SecA